MNKVELLEKKRISNFLKCSYIQLDCADISKDKYLEVLVSVESFRVYYIIADQELHFGVFRELQDVLRFMRGGFFSSEIEKMRWCCMNKKQYDKIDIQAM